MGNISSWFLTVEFFLSRDKARSLLTAFYLKSRSGDFQRLVQIVQLTQNALSFGSKCAFHNAFIAHWIQEASCSERFILFFACCIRRPCLATAVYTALSITQGLSLEEICWLIRSLRCARCSTLTLYLSCPKRVRGSDEIISGKYFPN